MHVHGFTLAQPEGMVSFWAFRFGSLGGMAPAGNAPPNTSGATVRDLGNQINQGSKKR